MTETLEKNLREFRVPRLFLSYRSDDTGDIINELADQLGADFGQPCVYQYSESNVPGRPWREQMEQHLADADGVIAVVGSDWAGARPDGTVRIAEDGDMVRRELELALDDTTKPSPVPVVVDITTTEWRQQLPPGVLDSMFTHEKAPHVLETSREALLDADGLDYQRLVVGAWYSLAEDISDAVLVIGDFAKAELATFLSELDKAEHLTSELSRLGANVYALPRRALKRRLRKKFPDVVLLVDDAGEGRRFDSLKRALEEHPACTSVAVLGVGATLGALGTTAVTNMLGSTGGASTTTAHVGTSTFLASSAALPTAAIAAAGTVVAVGTVGVIAILPDLDFDVPATAALAPMDAGESAYPFGTNEAVQVSFGDEMPTTEVGELGSSSTEYVSRSLVVELPGEAPINMCCMIVPKGLTGAAAEANEDREFRIAELQTEVALSFAELQAPDSCAYTGTGEVVGGWTFAEGELAEVTVTLISRLDGTDIDETFARVRVDAPAEKQFFEGVEITEEIIDRCQDRQSVRPTWTSEEQ